MVREITLTKGYVTVVDAEDFEMFGARRWYAHFSNGNIYASSSRPSRTYLHRVITKAPKGVVVDHINGDTLDNRRSNLRLCTQVQNMRNRVGVTGRDLPKGVARRETDYANGSPRYTVGIHVDGRRIYLGDFSCPVEGGRAYDAAAIKHFGEFARLNFPDQHPDLQGAAR